MPFRILSTTLVSNMCSCKIVLLCSFFVQKECNMVLSSVAESPSGLNLNCILEWYVESFFNTVECCN